MASNSELLPSTDSLSLSSLLPFPNPLGTSMMCTSSSPPPPPPCSSSSSSSSFSSEKHHQQYHEQLYPNHPLHNVQKFGKSFTTIPPPPPPSSSSSSSFSFTTDPFNSHSLPLSTNNFHVQTLAPSSSSHDDPFSFPDLLSLHSQTQYPPPIQPPIPSIGSESELNFSSCSSSSSSSICVCPTCYFTYMHMLNSSLPSLNDFSPFPPLYPPFQAEKSSSIPSHGVPDPSSSSHSTMCFPEVNPLSSSFFPFHNNSVDPSTLNCTYSSPLPSQFSSSSSSSSSSSFPSTATSDAESFQNLQNSDSVSKKKVTFSLLPNEAPALNSVKLKETSSSPSLAGSSSLHSSLSSSSSSPSSTSSSSSSSMLNTFSNVPPTPPSFESTTSTSSSFQSSISSSSSSSAPHISAQKSTLEFEIQKVSNPPYSATSFLPSPSSYSDFFIPTLSTFNFSNAALGMTQFSNPEEIESLVNNLSTPSGFFTSSPSSSIPFPNQIDTLISPPPSAVPSSLSTSIPFIPPLLTPVSSLSNFNPSSIMSSENTSPSLDSSAFLFPPLSTLFSAEETQYPLMSSSGFVNPDPSAFSSSSSSSSPSSTTTSSLLPTDAPAETSVTSMRPLFLPTTSPVPPSTSSTTSPHRDAPETKHPPHHGRCSAPTMVPAPCPSRPPLGCPRPSMSPTTTMQLHPMLQGLLSHVVPTPTTSSLSASSTTTACVDPALIPFLPDIEDVGTDFPNVAQSIQSVGFDDDPAPTASAAAAAALAAAAAAAVAAPVAAVARNLVTESPRCTNCGVTYTPLWRRSQRDLLLCNACGLYERMHSVPRPKLLCSQNLKPPPPPVCLSCENCEASKTSLWRRGDQGQLLCNACALYFRLHKKHRPARMKTGVVKKRQRSLRRKTTASSSNSSTSSPKSMASSLACSDSKLF